MKSKKLIVIILTIVILVYIVGYILIEKFSKEDNTQLEQIYESEVVFTPTEKYIANKIKKEFEKQNYINYQNIKNFEITKFQQYGYFKSQSNVRYIYVYFEYECKDETIDCVNIPYVSYSEDNSFMVVIDLNDQNYLKFQKGFSSTIDQIDDLVQDYTMPEYNDLKE